MKIKLVILCNERQNIAMGTLFTNEAVVDKVTKESRLFQSKEKLLGKFHVKNSDEKSLHGQKIVLGTVCCHMEMVKNSNLQIFPDHNHSWNSRR